MLSASLPASRSAHRDSAIQTTQPAVTDCQASLTTLLRDADVLASMHARVRAEAQSASSCHPKAAAGCCCGALKTLTCWWPARWCMICTSRCTSATSSAVVSLRFDMDLQASCSFVFLSVTRRVVPNCPLPSTLPKSYLHKHNGNHPYDLFCIALYAWT